MVLTCSSGSCDSFESRAREIYPKGDLYHLNVKGMSLQINATTY
jgi:hypothetical protein